MAPLPASDQRLALVEQVLRLPEGHLPALRDFLASLASAPPATVPTPAPRPDWPHAPVHRISEAGTYIVTAGTLYKKHHFRGPERLTYLEGELLKAAREAGWRLEAWAVFSNHYHFVGHRDEGSLPGKELIQLLHGRTSAEINRLDGARGRQVWFNYWDTALTYPRSYLARLRYVHENAVRHGLVAVANQYPWCSAAWFERTATPAQVRVLASMKIDRVDVVDSFEPVF